MFWSLVFAILSNLIVFAKMSEIQEINMADSHESKLDVVLKAIEALTARTEALENLASAVGTSPGTEIPQLMQNVAVEGPTPLPSQGIIVPTKILMVVLQSTENQESTS
jgi:hypothetical protein